MTTELQVEFLVTLRSGRQDDEERYHRSSAHIVGVVLRFNTEPSHSGHIPYEMNVHAQDMGAIDRALMLLSRLDEVVLETRHFDQGLDLADALVNVRDKVHLRTFGNPFIGDGKAI